MLRLPDSHCRWGLLAFLGGMMACGTPDDREVSLVRIAPEAAPNCGAPDDGRTMIVRALGEFPASEATAQSLDLGAGEPFRIERFPAETRMLEAEVRGFGGALRAVGRSTAFSLEALADDEEIPMFMAPLEGVCPTGPTAVARDAPKLAATAAGILVVGGADLAGEPSLAVELYRPAEGRFELLEATTYGDTSALGLEGASVTSLPSGDVAIVGGAATAYQVFSASSEQFLAPAFYREARGRHAAVALPNGQVFVAAGCSQISARACVDGALLRTSAVLDLESGEISQGPSLQIERIGGTAWLEQPGQILLVGGEDADGVPVAIAERVFLDGAPSQTVAGLAGPSAQTASGAVWAGLSQRSGAPEITVAALSYEQATATVGLAGSFADSGVVMASLDDGSILAVGELGAQRIRTLEGRALSIDVPELGGRFGHAAVKLLDGTVLITGGHRSNGDAAEALVFRPSLLGPESASSTASFSAADRSEGLSAQDPGRVVVTTDDGAHLELFGGVVPGRLFLAGPRPQTATMQVAAGVAGDASIRFYFGWQSASDYHEVEIGPDVAPRLVRVIGGATVEVGVDTTGTCSAIPVDAASIAATEGTHEMELRVQRTDVVLSVRGQAVLTCSLEDAPGPGMMGVGISGDAGTSLRIDLISLSR